MNWIRANKFLSGFIAVMVVAVGALGYLLYSAYSNYSDVSDQFTQTANDLHQLQSRVPYPDDANLAKYRAQRDDLIDATHTLAANLAQMVLPVEDITPSAFQDRLRDTISSLTAKATKSGVKLPEHFALDFDQYQTQPPLPAAAGPLGRQLAAIEIAMNILLDEHVSEVTSLTRTHLSQESSSGGGTNPPGGGGGFRPRGGGNASGPGALVEKVPFEIRFTAAQNAFATVLNDIAASKKQFFISRTLVIENTAPKPVPKVAPDASAGAAPATTGTDASGTGASTTPSYLSFLVGAEKVRAAMRVDMVAFNPPDKATRKGAAPAR